MKTIYSLLYGMLVLFNACGQSKVQEKFDTITTYSYTNSYGKDGRLAEVLINNNHNFWRMEHIFRDGLLKLLKDITTRIMIRT